MIKTLCIVRLSALGDVLMLVPLVRTIQTHSPHTAITWVISEPAYDLVKGLEGVEFIIIKKPQFLIDYWRFRQLIKRRKFDVLLATQASLRANLLYPLIPAVRKIGYDRLRAKDAHLWFVYESIQSGRDHTLDGFLRFAHAIGLDKPVIRWDLPILEKDRQWACKQLTQFKGKIILINPAASKPERSWLVEGYVAVIQYLQSHYQAEVILIGGPGAYDKQLGEQITAHVQVHNLIGQTKLTQLLALISQADLLLCPDTGPSHMAAAVATPVIALHAVTSKDVSGPYIYRHLAVDAYPQAVQVVLNRTVESNVWGTQAHGHSTMQLVTVDAVIAQLDHVLSTA